MSGPVLMALLEVNRTVSGPEERIARRTELFQAICPAFTRSTSDLFDLRRAEEDQDVIDGFGDKA